MQKKNNHDSTFMFMKYSINHGSPTFLVFGSTTSFEWLNPYPHLPFLRLTLCLLRPQMHVTSSLSHCAANGSTDPRQQLTGPLLVCCLCLPPSVLSCNLHVRLPTEASKPQALLLRATSLGLAPLPECGRSGKPSRAAEGNQAARAKPWLPDALPSYGQ